MHAGVPASGASMDFHDAEGMTPSESMEIAFTPTMQSQSPLSKAMSTNASTLFSAVTVPNRRRGSSESKQPRIPTVAEDVMKVSKSISELNIDSHKQSVRVRHEIPHRFSVVTTKLSK